MKNLNGRLVADKILSKLQKEIQQSETKPGLAVILVGKNSASEVYVKNKRIAARKVGVKFKLIRFDAKTEQRELISTIEKLNLDNKTHGIIVQLPLPRKYDTQKIISMINPKKDADGFHPENIRQFLAGKGSAPVFEKAIIRLIESSKIDLTDKKAIIVANSRSFGETMVSALKFLSGSRVSSLRLARDDNQENKKPKGLDAKYLLFKEFVTSPDIIKTADIIITATGKVGSIKGEMFKKGAIVVDGGITKIGKKVYGDVDFVSASKITAFISPVPGGVGPVTIACLLENVLRLMKANN
jgi:methylenetetrahydrofolate dehydrogenase (NADP+) / methenyltetrahydrofolate cyclohydrolase